MVRGLRWPVVSGRAVFRLAAVPGLVAVDLEAALALASGRALRPPEPPPQAVRPIKTSPASSVLGMGPPLVEAASPNIRQRRGAGAVPGVSRITCCVRASS